MLNQQTIEKLYTMRMRGMADAFTQQQEDPGSAQLGFEECFAMLVDRQWNWRQNRALERRLRDGRLQGPACIEDIDFRAARGLDKQVVRSLLPIDLSAKNHSVARIASVTFPPSPSPEVHAPNRPPLDNRRNRERTPDPVLRNPA